MSLKDLIARDIDTVFMNVDEFCDYMDIRIGNRICTCKGSLQSNRVDNTSGNGRPLQENTWTLYIKYPLMVHGEGAVFDSSLLSAGQRLLIDGESYTVVDISDEMGLATINLTTKAGR